jgi:hypothetical protein
LQLPLLDLLSTRLEYASLFAVFIDVVADAASFFTSWFDDTDFANPDWLGQFNDAALGVGLGWLDVLFDNVQTFDRNFVLTWVSSYDLASATFVFAGAYDNGVALFEADFENLLGFLLAH